MANTLNKVANLVTEQLPYASKSESRPASISPPVPWTDPSLEPPIEGEAEQVEELIDIVHRFQKKNFGAHRHEMRGTHVKTQGVVKGKLTVNAGLADYLAQGLFKQPGTYDVAARYANEPSFLQDDRTPGSRGLGLKVFGVSGAFLDPVGERTRTQDFTFNNAPILELTDLPTTVEIIKIRERNFGDHENLKKELKKRNDAELQMAPAQLPNKHPLSFAMYSQSSFRWGDFAAKYALFPSTDLQKSLDEVAVTADSDPQVISTWIQDFFGQNAAEYDFRVQILRDVSEQSVEDCSREWPEDKYPFETVGKVVFSAGQDSFDPTRRVFWDDRMKLNVWYGLEEHRPLGSANRLRKKLYQASSKFREAENAVCIEDVFSVDQIP